MENCGNCVNWRQRPENGQCRLHGAMLTSAGDHCSEWSSLPVIEKPAEQSEADSTDAKDWRVGLFVMPRKGVHTNVEWRDLIGRIVDVHDGNRLIIEIGGRTLNSPAGDWRVALSLESECRHAFDPHGVCYRCGLDPISGGISPRTAKAHQFPGRSTSRRPLYDRG